MFKKVDACKVVSIVGLAKNVGKTTVLNYFLKKYDRCGVTSIGVDGEEGCTVDGIKKPKVYMKKGTLFTTVEAELKTKHVSAKIMEKTGVITPFGNVIIAKAELPAYFEIYGCGSMAETEKVVNTMLQLRANKVFIDGAFFRVSSAKISSGCILVSGSNVKAGMEEVISETKKAVEFLNFEKASFKKMESVSLVKKGLINDLRLDGLLNNEASVCEKIDKETAQIFIPGAFTSQSYEIMKKKGFPFGKISMVLVDGTKCLLTKDEYRELVKSGGSIKVVNPITLCGVAINSFSTFTEDLNTQKLLEIMRNELKPLEVQDVLLKCS